MVAPSSVCPLSAGRSVTPPPEPETGTYVQLRSSTAVAASLLGLVGRKEVTVRSLRLDGAVRVVAEKGQAPVLAGFLRRSHAGLATQGRTPGRPRPRAGCALGPQGAARPD